MRQYQHTYWLKYVLLDAITVGRSSYILELNSSGLYVVCTVHCNIIL